VMASGRVCATNGCCNQTLICLSEIGLDHGWLRVLHGIAGHYLGVKMVWVEQDPKSQAATLKATKASGHSVSNSLIVSPQYPFIPISVHSGFTGLC
jgi:hypothetical protein